MIRYSRSAQAFATALAALAGFVDATGFLALGGFFVSFMSGNSTRLSVGLIHGSREAAIAAGLIAAFVVGVVLGSLVGRRASAHRAFAVLVLVSLLLAFSTLLSAAHLATAALAVVAVAMGAENTVFERDGDVGLGLTYMTGALVKLGQRLATAITGGDRLGWAPYLVLWSGLVSGAAAGAAVYRLLGLQTLWIASAAALLLAMVARRIGPRIG